MQTRRLLFLSLSLVQELSHEARNFFLPAKSLPNTGNISKQRASLWAEITSFCWRFRVCAAPVPFWCGL
jgi:hypothetical protein